MLLWARIMVIFVDPPFNKALVGGTMVAAKGGLLIDSQPSNSTNPWSNWSQRFPSWSQDTSSCDSGHAHCARKYWYLHLSGHRVFLAGNHHQKGDKGEGEHTTPFKGWRFQVLRKFSKGDSWWWQPGNPAKKPVGYGQSRTILHGFCTSQVGFVGFLTWPSRGIL